MCLSGFKVFDGADNLRATGGMPLDDECSADGAGAILHYVQPHSFVFVRFGSDSHTVIAYREYKLFAVARQADAPRVSRARV